LSDSDLKVFSSESKLVFLCKEDIITVLEKKHIHSSSEVHTVVL
jgi:hypothetical protein